MVLLLLAIPEVVQIEKTVVTVAIGMSISTDAWGLFIYRITPVLGALAWRMGAGLCSNCFMNGMFVHLHFGRLRHVSMTLIFFIGEDVVFRFLLVLRKMGLCIYFWWRVEVHLKKRREIHESSSRGGYCVNRKTLRTNLSSAVYKLHITLTVHCKKELYLGIAFLSLNELPSKVQV